MIQKKAIEDILSTYISQHPNLFVVDIKVSRSNDIEIYFDSSNHTLSLKDCTELSRYVEERLDRDKEDFSLTVSSAGLDKPFKVLEQYKKFEGSDVTLELKDGRKLKGTLISGNDDGIEFRYEVKEKVDGETKRTSRQIGEKIEYANINRCRLIIEF